MTDTTFIPSHTADGAKFKRSECAICGGAKSYVEVADVWVHDTNGRENCGVRLNTITEHRVKQTLTNGEWDGIHWANVATAASYDPWGTHPVTPRPELSEREELLAEAARKPVRRFTQYDAEHEPRDENGDREGDVIWVVERNELRNTDFAVRVQILHGADTVYVATLLRKILESIESEAASVNLLAESHSPATLRAAADLADKRAPF